MTILYVVAAGLGAAVLISGLHLLATWAEARGWIYYRKGRGSTGAGARAMLELQSFLEPSTLHVIEERRNLETEQAGQEAPGDEPR